MLAEHTEPAGPPVGLLALAGEPEPKVEKEETGGGLRALVARDAAEPQPAARPAGLWSLLAENPAEKPGNNSADYPPKEEPQAAAPPPAPEPQEELVLGRIEEPPAPAGLDAAFGDWSPSLVTSPEPRTPGAPVAVDPAMLAGLDDTEPSGLALLLGAPHEAVEPEISLTPSYEEPAGPLAALADGIDWSAPPSLAALDISAQSFVEPLDISSPTSVQPEPDPRTIAGRPFTSTDPAHLATEALTKGGTRKAAVAELQESLDATWGLPALEGRRMPILKAIELLQGEGKVTKFDNEPPKKRRRSGKITRHDDGSVTFEIEDDD